MANNSRGLSSRRVWFITGSSSDLGHCLALTALSRGDRVIAAASDIENIQDLRVAGACVMQLDVRENFPVIQSKAAEAIKAYGLIDVVVNDAGYSMFGALEEVGVEGFMEQYKTNVFGVISVTNAFLPYLRDRKSGTVVVIGSGSSWETQSALAGPFRSSQAAVHAIAETLMEELRPFGIRVLLVQSGGFRTEKTINSVHQSDGGQPGDPQKAVDVIADVIRGEGCAIGKQWPNFLVLGADAEKEIRSKYSQVLEHLDDVEWQGIGRRVAL